MRKNLFIRKVFIFLILVLGSNVSYSQLSGTYTIGSSSGSSFQSFSQAVAQLSNMGVTGPVVMRVEPGIYTEQVVIPQINGVSDSNTITFESFNGNLNSVEISFSPVIGSINYTLNLTNTSHIRFRNMTISSQGISLNRVIFINAYAVDIVFDNCSFKSNGHNNSLIYIDNLSKIRDLVFENSTFENGLAAVQYQRNNAYDTGLIIRQCTFKDQLQYGLWLRGQTNSLIEGNTFVSSVGVYGYEAVRVDNCKTGNRILSNTFRLKNLLTGSKAVSVYISGNYSGRNLVANNFISLHSNDQCSGIELNESKNTDLYHNSIMIYGSNRYATCLSLIKSDSVRIRNNIASNISGSFVINYTGNTNVEMDFNIYYTTFTYFATMNLTNFTDLKTWSSNTTFDLNSSFINPDFISNTDLHTNSIHLNDLGTPLIEVRNDFDGQVRSMINPDPGADEYSPYDTDMAIDDVLYPVKNENCNLGKDQHISLRLINKGLSRVDSFMIHFSVDSGRNYLVSEKVLRQLKSGDTLDYISSGTFSFSDQYKTFLSALVVCDSDRFALNDTFHQTIKRIRKIDHFPFLEDFEKGYSEYFTPLHQRESKVTIDKRAAYNGNFGLHFQGYDWRSNWIGTLNGTSAYEAWELNTSSQAYIKSCIVDATGLDKLRLQFKLRQTFSWGNKFSWFRVLVNDSIQLVDQNGQMNFNPTSGNDSFVLKVFDLNDFAGSQFRLTFQAACKHEDQFHNEGDNVFIDDIRLFETAKSDIGILEIINPTLSYCANDSDQFLVRLKNFGADTQFYLPVKVLVHTPVDTIRITRTFSRALGPNECDTFLVGYINTNHLGRYYFRISTELVNDTIYSNDTLVDVVHFSPVISMPYLMDFDSSNALFNWYGKNFWNSYKGAHQTASAALSNNIWSEDSVMVAIYKKRIGTITPYTHILFDYRIVNFYPPFNQMKITDRTKLHVLVSTDCGRNFDTVFSVDSSFHQPSRTMKNVQLKLNRYSGEDVMIGFVFESDSFNFNYVDIDNILLANLPVVELPNDTFACRNDSLFIEVPYISDFTYNWYPVNQYDTLNDSNVYYPDTTGKYVLKVTNSGGFSNSDTILIRVYPNPEVRFTFDSMVCKNELLEIKAKGGTSYYWSTGDTTSVINIRIMDSVRFVVEVGNQFNCFTKDSFEIIPRPLPVREMFSDSSICEMDSLVLVLNLNQAYLWSTGDTNRRITIQPNQTKQYWVKSINEYGCELTDTFEVRVKPLPEINLGNDTIGNADQHIKIIISNPSEYDSIIWMDNSRNDYHIFDTIGYGLDTQLVFVKVYKERCSNSDTVLVGFKIPDGRQELHQNHLKIFPNPARDYLFIKTGIGIRMNYRIIDVSARKCLEGGLESEEATIFKLNLSGLDKGIYFLYLSGNEGTYSVKFIKE